ncbi:MAG: hypothetical protein EBT93_05435 [Alphaproteobacteria bacterium]|nr:hypothetical protein [Alphaproteobacteria bacterium]
MQVGRRNGPSTALNADTPAPGADQGEYRKTQKIRLGFLQPDRLVLTAMLPQVQRLGALRSENADRVPV